MRVATQAVMQELKYATLEQILKKNPALNKSFSTYRMKIITGKGIPLDYIMNLPKKIIDHLTAKSKRRLIHTRADDISAALS